MAHFASVSWMRKHIAGGMVERDFDADDNLSEDTKQFVDWHMAPGEKRPPALSVRRATGADHALRVSGRKASA